MNKVAFAGNKWHVYLDYHAVAEDVSKGSRSTHNHSPLTLSSIHYNIIIVHKLPYVYIYILPLINVMTGWRIVWHLIWGHYMCKWCITYFFMNNHDYYNLTLFNAHYIVMSNIVSLCNVSFYCIGWETVRCS